jgi:hypothetical protein
MSKRRLYAYRLHVTYHPTSHHTAEGEWNWDWQPEGWEHPGAKNWNGDPDTDFSFSWPRVKTYLSRKSAEERAKLLEEYGAKVTIERSLPVTWISDIAVSITETTAPAEAPQG